MSKPIYDIKDCNKIKIYDKETGSIIEEIERIQEQIHCQRMNKLDIEGK